MQSFWRRGTIYHARHGDDGFVITPAHLHLPHGFEDFSTK
ncbi:hypothetical protein LT85_2442 [Collimonas arenae]|uniref:Uncharacterized protein n=1 Tax=Collimonas arenae TaxID=279058 RepID=A0A0A1FCT6_9BURK|nr:hypothetical protein LT85_2442 [Collimonas arenae]